MRITPTDNIPFGYKSILKTLWVEGDISKDVKYGFYGGELTRDTLSLEHIQCVSKQGKTELNNLALATKQLNELRGNKPLKFFLQEDKFIQYIKQFENIKLKGFDGKKYIEELIKTVINALKNNL